MGFIAIEGLDGAGSTTLSKELADEIAPDDTVHRTAEPYTGTISEQATVHERVFGFLHDRAKHCREIIKPMCMRSDVVICDRYRDSTLAYQAHDFAESMGYSDLRDAWKHAVYSLNSLHKPWVIEPDVTVYIDVPVETAMRRNDGGETYEELLDAKEVYDYLYYGEYHDSKTVIVDGTNPVDMVVDEAKWKLREYHSLYE